VVDQFWGRSEDLLSFPFIVVLFSVLLPIFPHSGPFSSGHDLFREVKQKDLKNPAGD
jgi:hypothetical protein